MEPIKIKDKTVLKTLGLSGNGMAANCSAVDVLDGKIARIRPLHFDTQYSKDELRYWKLEKDGHVLEPGMKTLLPAFSIAYKKRTYSKNRVPFPMKRIDWDPAGERNPQNRGKSKYERISWDEALSIISSEIARIEEKYDLYSILSQSDGHGECKVFNGGHGCFTTLMQTVYGCTTQARNPDSWEGWYWGAKHVWGMDPVGEQIFQGNCIKDIMDNADAILYWGCDVETTPWGWAGQMAGRVTKWFKDIGKKSIYICPDLNYAAAIHADKWIPILPNTDAAMQLAIAYVWLTENTYDREYIDTHSVGFDWFEYYVLGEEDGIPKTPEWAAEKCGVPSWKIKALARFWAKNAVSIAHGNGGSYIRSAFSHEPGRLEVYLLAMQGLGKPGANQFKMLEWRLFGFATLYPLPLPEKFPSVEHAYHGWDMTPGESFIPKTLIPQAILNPPIKWHGHTLPGAPTPDQFYEFEFPAAGHDRIHMIYSDCPCWSTCWNGGNKFQDALRDPSIETIVIEHPWLENDCLFADIILPVQTILDCGDDLAHDESNGQFAMLYYQEKAVEPVGEAKSDYEISVEIAKALEPYGGVFENIVERFLGDRGDFEEVAKRILQENNLPGFTYENMREKQFWCSPTSVDWEDIPHGMSEFYNDPDNHPLATPSGKLEFYSTALATNFPDDKERGPVAHWVEESPELQERKSCERAKKYPYLLVSNHPHWRIHAQLDDIPWIREIVTCKVKGPDGYMYEPVWINPKDAEQLGIKSGDVVRVFNERGSVLGGAVVQERIVQGAIYQDHGSRCDAIVRGEGGLDRGGANNLIAPSATSSKNAAGEVTGGYLVGVEKVNVFDLAAKYPEQFNRNYDEAYGLVPEAYLA